MNLIISNTFIRQDADGRFCLNDIHRAAGGHKRHQPANWLRMQQTEELIEELNSEGIPQIRGIARRQGLGTFVCKELVYAYAMWVSPKFHLQVIRNYDELVRGELDRLNSLQFRAVEAEFKFLTGVAHAS